MRHRFVFLALALLAAGNTTAQDLSCAEGALTIRSGTQALSTQTCDAATRALTLINGCGLTLDEPVTLSVVDDLPANCFGQFHCDEALIEVLAPARLQDVLPPDSVYRSVPPDLFFESIVTHELAHAATEDIPCPFESCLTAQEYISYALQIQSLPPEVRSDVIEPRFNRTISRDELSVMILFMAPDIFAQKAWMHFSQRDDPCGYVQQLADGTVLLDFERF